jgi:hypothetical protein
LTSTSSKSKIPTKQRAAVLTTRRRDRKMSIVRFSPPANNLSN